MAEIRDEYGDPIPLTDEFGRPVQLTNEHGVPVHLTGVATPVDSGLHGGTAGLGTEPKMHGGTHFAPTPGDAVVGAGGAPLSHPETGVAEGEKQQLGRAGSSSSSSSEEVEEGEGGGRRRKKKGLMQKIKEKLPGHKNKVEEEGSAPPMVYTATTKVSVTTPGGPPDAPKTEFIRVEHHEEEHKKGLMDKIKDKLPGHH